ncbi:interleukin-21 receptor [Anarrhichthys ocellatus]|uniref:interleukin-21 receptor n=1 Tax=Anarrhichthys ocellatus TaxID=433405 RepID=UPI0012EE1C9D|nr:interleukin-21 receptor-like [Anarrhichthys ocellatus]
MDCRSPPRLKLLFAFLLVSTNSVCLHGTPVTGVDHHLHCVNDYLYTINCSLSIATSENYSDSNSSYWLTFIETYEKKKFVCTLTNTDEDYFCSLRTSNPIPDEDAGTFIDLDCFEISLCHSQNDGPEICEQLVDKYLPMNNITPNAPCQLTVSPNAGQHHFTWISTYEEYEDYTSLVENLKFQLHYYKRGDTRLLSHEINTNSLNYSVDDENFEPDTKYAARVRSSPNQAYYKGQWSDWSSEVYWGTESAGNVHTELSSNTFVSGLGKTLIPLCVLVPFVLLFCYTPIKKWRQSAFIPTPAPYFHTLYSDFQGDFKSWVVTQENTADMLKAEETLQIDNLTECQVVEEEEEESQLQFHHQLMEGGMYSNITDPGCDTLLLGIPYTVITMVPPSSAGSSHQSLTLSSQPGSPAQGDSGCWLEKDLPRYCTMSAFQQSGPVTAEDPGSSSTKSCSCATGLIRMEAITEA